MLKDILGFLQEIGNYFAAVWDFITGLISDTVYVIKLLASLPFGLQDASVFFGWLPSSIVVFLVGLMAVAVIYKILGREG